MAIVYSLDHELKKYRDPLPNGGIGSSARSTSAGFIPSDDLSDDTLAAEQSRTRPPMIGSSVHTSTTFGPRQQAHPPEWISTSDQTASADALLY